MPALDLRYASELGSFISSLYGTLVMVKFRVNPFVSRGGLGVTGSVAGPIAVRGREDAKLGDPRIGVDGSSTREFSLGPKPRHIKANPCSFQHHNR